MSYFENFPKRWVELPNGESVLLTNITRVVAIPEEFRKNEGLSISYAINDLDRPDSISERLYGTNDYWWTVLAMNGMFNIWEDWPMTVDQLNQYIEQEYPDNHYSDTLLFVTPDGNQTDIQALKMTSDFSTDEDIISVFQLREISILEYETEINDKKRNIRLVHPDYISMFAGQVEDMFNE